MQTRIALRRLYDLVHMIRSRSVLHLGYAIVQGFNSNNIILLKLYNYTQITTYIMRHGAIVEIHDLH